MVEITEKIARKSSNTLDKILCYGMICAPLLYVAITEGPELYRELSKVPVQAYKAAFAP